MSRKTIGAGLLVLLAACSAGGSLTYRSPGPYYGGPALGEGTYLAVFEVTPAQGEPYRFNATFRRRIGFALISALSPGGKRVFHVRDSLRREEEPEMQFLPSELSSHAPELAQLYRVFRTILLLQDKPSRRDPLVRESYADGRPRRLGWLAGEELAVEEYDWEGHAAKLALTAPSFHARVSLREYAAAD